MATVTENIDLPVQWDVDSAVRTIKDRINHAKNMSTRRYIFIGETHSSPFDKSRNHSLGYEFLDDNGVILIAERGIWNHSGLKYFRMVEALKHGAANTWQEPSSDAKSIADTRNVMIADEIVRRVHLDESENPHAAPKPVVIIFGEDHNARIREKLLTRLADDVRICWWSAKSIMEYFHILPTRLPTALGNAVCVGFVPLLADEDQRLQFLTKGKMSAAISIKLYNVPANKESGFYYAIFLKNTDPLKETIFQHYYGPGPTIDVTLPLNGAVPNCAAELVSHGRLDLLLKKLTTDWNS